MKTLSHDDNATIADLIGYSYRKLSDFKDKDLRYERALRADPNHVETWQYYGLWRVPNRVTAIRRSIT